MSSSGCHWTREFVNVLITLRVMTPPHLKIDLFARVHCQVITRSVMSTFFSTTFVGGTTFGRLFAKVPNFDRLVPAASGKDWALGRECK